MVANRTRRASLAAVVALAGWACAGAPEAPPAREPVRDERAQERDLFPELSSQLERQMAEQRAAALARGAELKAKEIDPFGAQGFESRLTELGVPAFAGCARGASDWPRMDALVALRRVDEGDFWASSPVLGDAGESRALRERAPATPIVHVSCTLEVEVEPVIQGGFEARLREVRFVALFDREISWWNPDQRGDESTRAHAQVHLDLAYLLAREATRSRTAPLRARGPTERSALDRLGLLWANHLGEIDRELRALERQLDLETSQGWDAAASQRWAERLRGGLGAVRAAMPAR
ncbi:MAG: hypothetical protein CL910_22445 [Deltaproteobacteria bacterium]|nr:hypothetical protein [Deltaproteobacteria bacterium]